MKKNLLKTLCLLMLAQQLFMPRSFCGNPTNMMQKVDERVLTATEVGLVNRREHGAHIAYAAAFYASRGEHIRAQKWIQLGAGVFRLPSMMVFYGDYLTHHRRYKAARHWYNLAESCAWRDGQKNFILLLRKKIGILNASEKRELKK